MKLIVVVLFTSVFGALTHAADLGEEMEHCFSLTQSAPKKCVSVGRCEMPRNEDVINKCLLKIGFDISNCQNTGFSLTCNAEFVSKRIPQAKNLKLSISRSTTFATLGLTPEQKQLDSSFDGFSMKDSGFPIETAVRKKDGTWHVETIGIPIGIEQISPKDEIIITETVRTPEAPWQLGGSESSKCNQIPENFGAGAKPEHLARLRRNIGFTHGNEVNGQRHFVGRKGPKVFPIVNQFMFKKDVKICGFTLAKETKLRVEISQNSCDALTDGAVDLSGFPIKLFPTLAASNHKPEATVVCAPKAQALSNYTKLMASSVYGQKSIVLPKLDWQQCDCQIATEEDFRD